MKRRQFIGLAGLSALAAPQWKLTRIELIPVRATARTVWLFVRLHAGNGMSGLGEASDAFGFGNTTRPDAARMESELAAFFELVRDRSPLDIESFLQRGLERARNGGLVAATAYSAIEQALWDLTGKALDAPVHTFFGGKVRQTLPVYANINRATNPRTPAGFAASARAAAKDGFRSVKAAPFDGFPKSGTPQREVDAFVDQGVACVLAIREAVGPDVAVMIDCHSFFSVELSKSVARRLEPAALAWYEEPVAPVRAADTAVIRRAIRQKMAGGETLFGVAGFAPLVEQEACDVIMPDVKHCGGLLELTRIAAHAASRGVTVAPHNPSGPVATAASIHVCAGMRNFAILEMQWGEVDWRGSLVRPAERFVNGAIAVSDAPGLGVTLEEAVAARYALA